MLPILPIPEAARRAGNDFITDFYWRKHPTLERVADAVRDDYAGALRSLRFTCCRPKKSAGSRDGFLYQDFAAALDGAALLTGMLPEKLYLRCAAGSNYLFALAGFADGTVAEFECSETLPNTLGDICFLKANFAHGHLTNQPLVGYTNEEGMLLADDEQAVQLNADYPGMPLFAGPIEYMKGRFRLAAEAGLVPPGPGHAGELVAMIREALQ